MSDQEIGYRAYIIGSDGHIASFRELACDSDADAINQAKGLVGGHDVELWNGKRLVIRLEAKPQH